MHFSSSSSLLLNLVYSKETLNFLKMFKEIVLLHSFWRSYSLSYFLRLALVLVWVFIILSFIWTHDLNGALYSLHFHFDLNKHPNFMDLFNFSDISLRSRYWWLAKIGHLIGFALLDFFLFLLIRSKRTTLIITVTFAIVTEVVQLYFYRDGRLYDICIDSLGALLAYFFL